jgi:hypothetical protein
MTFDVRACMTQSLETSRRVFRVSTLHEDARKVVGNDHYEGLVREAVSLLARLGATVPPEYVGRSCFYDITRDLKRYTDQSAQVRILFDRGVVLDGHPCRRHRCLLGSRTWLSFRTRRRGLEHLQLAPLSFSLACGCALPSSLFSPALVSPCASRTRHGLTTRHFSHWPRRTRTITIGPFPPCGATGDVGLARGRKRGGIEAVR